MIIKVIFGQRKESYPGEFCPEALEAMDEYCYEENPQWLNNKLAAHKKDISFASVTIVDIIVDGEAVQQLLTATPKIEGKIK